MINSKYVTLPDGSEVARFDFSRKTAGQGKKWISDAAELLYSGGYGHIEVDGVVKPFEELLVSEKIDIVGKYLDMILTDFVKSKRTKEAIVLVDEALKAEGAN